MPDLAPVEQAIATARAAVATDVANVAAAIDAAIASIDEQLATLHGRREELEAALAGVTAQIAAIDGHREGLLAARSQTPGDGSATSTPDVAEGGETDGTGESDEDYGEEDYLEFTEEELDPAVARTERIVTVLTRAQQGMKATEIADILNQFGDNTTAKVVGGTLSGLLRRGAVTRAGSGMYASS